MRVSLQNFLVVDSNSSISCSSSFSHSVCLSLRFCDIISNHCTLCTGMRTPKLYSVYSFAQFVHFETDSPGWTVCTVLYSLDILKLISHKGTYMLYSLLCTIQFETDWYQRDTQTSRDSKTFLTLPQLEDFQPCFLSSCFNWKLFSTRNLRRSGNRMSSVSHLPKGGTLGQFLLS